MEATPIDPEVQRLINQVARDSYWSNIFSYGWDLYFVLFGIGVLVLVAATLLPERSSNPRLARLAPWRGRLMVCSAALLLLLLAVSQQTGIDQERGFIADQEKRYEKAIRTLSTKKNKEEILKTEYLYMPEGDSLTAMTLNNTGLAADYMWLTSLQYVSSSFRRGQKFQMLSRFYSTMQDLDPGWTEAAINAGKVLSALEPDRFKVEEFYTKAIVNNPDDVRLLYEAGRLFVVPPQDPKQQRRYSDRAVGWFRRYVEKMRQLQPTPEIATRIQDAEDMIARLGLEAGYYKAAADLLYKHATDEKNPDAMRTLAARDWLNAKSLAITNDLEDMLDAYKKEHGNYPPSLEPIFESLPDKGKEYERDAFGFKVEYNPATGAVSSRGVNAKRAIQAAAIINEFAAMYQAEHDHPPKTLEELREFVRGYFTPALPASFNVIDALGEDLDILRSPIGKWDFDPATGRINLPPYCENTALFKPAERLFKPKE